MSKAAAAIVVVLSVLAGCLVGIPIGYIGPKVYEGNFIPTPTATLIPTVTPTPPTVFVPSGITLEELRMQETVTVRDYVSLHLRTEEQIESEGLRPSPAKTKRTKVNLAVMNKRLQAFEGTVTAVELSNADECVIGVFSDDYPNFRNLVAVSADWCTSLGANSKVLMSGIISKIHRSESGSFLLELDDVGLSVR